MIIMDNQFHKEEVGAYVTELLANYCMPTLLKSKPSTLITANKKYIDSLDEFQRVLEYSLIPFKCSYFLLCEMDIRLFILVYDEDLLYEAVSLEHRKQFLSTYGYDLKKDILGNTLKQLQQRYMAYWSSVGGFPHEIGIILGYPLADVEGFINNNGQNYLYCGMWKVYENVEITKSIFEIYHRLKVEALRLIESGLNLTDIYQSKI